MSVFRSTLVAAAMGLALTASAKAQHANFVLFGDPTPAAKEAPDNNKFVHPVTSPYYHEDSFVTTDLRLWAAYHDFPASSPIGGGDAQLLAAQIRLALTNQIQFVAYKDGYTNMNSGIIDDDGFNDVAAGVKWNFLQDWENQLHAAVGVGYEIPIGDPSILHNDDEWRFWGSVNKGFGPLHLGATLNFRLADGDGESPLGNSDNMSWHAHIDYYLCEFFSPVVEFNGYHLLDKGTESVPFSGVDLLNLGGGDDVVTMGIGGEFRVIKDVAARAAYEFPLSDEEDLFGYRWTLSFVLSF
jgi:hypothetical protein